MGWISESELKVSKFNYGVHLYRAFNFGFKNKLSETMK